MRPLPLEQAAVPHGRQAMAIGQQLVSSVQVVCKDRIDVLAVQASTSKNVSTDVLELVRGMPTSVLVWRDLEARAAQLDTLEVMEDSEQQRL